MGVQFKEDVLRQLNQEKDDIEKKLQLKTTEIKDITTVLAKSSEHIAMALNKIEHSNMDFPVKRALKENINELNKLLVHEPTLSTKLLKYNMLAQMLNTVIIDDKASLEDKQQSLIDYLHAFKQPQSKAQLASTITLGVAGLALMLGLSIASLYLVPLIPFAAAFAWMGLTGAGLSFATGTATIATQFGSALAGMVIIQKLNNLLIKPLAILFNAFTNEYKTATKVHDFVHMGFFESADAPKEDEKKQTFDDNALSEPLLSSN
jgi:hypothetical protein